MIRRTLDSIYGTTPASFESSFSLEESVRRLEAATKQSPFSALTTQEAVGRVSEDKVVLRRSIPFVANSFKPFFVGRFERSGSGVVLRGRFTMHWAVRAFLTYWFGFCVVWLAIATYSLVGSSGSQQWWFPLVGVVMLGFGFSLVWTGKYFSRKDVAWLSSVIEAALAPDAQLGESSEPKPLRGAG